MKTNLLLTALILGMGLMATAALAQDDGEVTETPDAEMGQGHGVCQFIDEDGDGFNDLAPDADGDGIPNGLDEDYEGAQLQLKYKWGESEELFGHFGEGEISGNTYQYGPGDGTGTAVGPNDGTGFGPGTGSGEGPEDGEATADSRQERTGQGSGK